MITGPDARIVTRYLPIDRCGKCLTWVIPEKDEKFIGHPYGWHGEGSAPFIEVVKNGLSICTINCADIAEIEFDVS